jgi:hypothetical protein
MAQTSSGSKEIQLVQHTAKRDRGDRGSPPPLPCRPRNCITLGCGTESINYDRLQFKSATQNNGKRRAAQKYHVLFCELLAKIDDGIVRVASAESVPLVVRGRAPGHYSKSANYNQDEVVEEYTANSPVSSYLTMATGGGELTEGNSVYEWGYLCFLC